MTGPRFDFTINLGHILTIGGVLITMIMGFTTFDNRLRSVEKTQETTNAILIQTTTLAADYRALGDRVARVERVIERMIPQ